MKKFLTALLCAVIAALSAVGFAACGSDTSAITVYAPDGAPALAMAQLLNYNADFGKNVQYRVVLAQEIASSVTYKDESKNADLCILPVNTASKLLGNGSRYKMLGTVTHGNLFLVAAADKAELTAQNFAAELSGAKIGVVNLAAFPGSAIKLLLNKYGILENVTLEGVAASAVTGVESGYDYFVIPEPAASTRVGNAALNLKTVGSLQTLYGEGGYPQAVLVAKNSLIESEPEFIADFTAAMESSASWLLQTSVSAQTIFNAVKSGYADPENTTPAFAVGTLNKNVLSNCAIRFEDCATCSEKVTNFLSELIAVNDSTATAVSQNFFYFGN